MLRALLQVSLAGALLSTALFGADPWEKKFTVTGRPDLRVDANDGSVTIRVWDRKEIQARVITTGWKPGEVTVADHQMGDRVELEVRIPHSHFQFNFGQHSVRVELDVPRELRSDIHTGDGGINVD